MNIDLLKQNATIRHSKRFRESALAHKLFDGHVIIAIGDSAHNDWGLRTVNVDYTADMDTVFKKAEVEMCGEARAVEVVANGDNLPFPDKSFYGVISSHVIEHFFDPIKAIKEWCRVATHYVFIICPQPNADPSDRGKLITGLQELVQRHTGEIPPPEVDDHRHWTRWTYDTFVEMCAAYGWKVSHGERVDLKVGNGFTIVIDLQSKLIL